jgi:tRNA-dihydrouridine synthase
MPVMGFWESLPRPFSVLAPMENVTDTVFRRFIADCGAPDVFFTEFTNVDILFTKQKHRQLHRLDYTEPERPLVAQLYGTDPENYFRAAAMVQELGFDGIDINMGCPAASMRRRKTCSGLINHPEHAADIVRAAQEGAPLIPVSVKTRLGVQFRVTESWTRHLLSLDIPVLTMHARIAKDMSNVPADWEEMHTLTAIREEMGVETLLVGNGDVQDRADLFQKAEEYKVDGVMIGRGIFSDPFLFHETRRLHQLNRAERIDLLLRHMDLFMEVWGDRKDFAILKKFFKIYMSDFDGALELRQELMMQSDPDGVRAVLGIA